MGVGSTVDGQLSQALFAVPGTWYMYYGSTGTCIPGIVQYNDWLHRSLQYVVLIVPLVLGRTRKTTPFELPLH